MPNRVVDPNEVSLNGVLYPVTGPVQLRLVSVYPEKNIAGDVSKDSQPNASVISWNDWRGGIGVNRQTEREPTNRAWWSTCHLRQSGHLLLPRLATLTAASGVAGSFNVDAMGELASEVYAAFGTSVRKYNNVTDSWGTSLTTLPATATQALSFRLGGVQYLAFAHTDGFTYSSDGVAWTLNAKDAKYLLFWDDRLWGIDNTGLLWRMLTIGAAGTNDAQLPLADGSVTSLVTARNAAGNIVIYALTVVGPYQHDSTNSKFEVAEPGLPTHADNGKGVMRWRDSKFISSGLAIYAVINGSDHATVTVMGPDQQGGLPTSQQGSIIKLAGSHTDLLALIDGTTPAAEVDMFDSGGLGSHVASVINVDTGFSEILGWDERGWDCKWLAAANTASASAILISSAYSQYRMWWGHNGRVYWQALPTGLVNPDQVTSFAYAASAEHITPWVTMDAKDVDALALALHVECQRMTATETVVVDYGLDYSETWTTFGTITASGVTTYNFPNSTTPTGTVFRAIRFRLTFARGSVNTNSPDVISLTLVYRKKLKPRWGGLFTVQLVDWKGKSARELSDALVVAGESNLLMEFTCHDDTTSGNPRNYYVDVTFPNAGEETGRDFTGFTQVMVTEP